MSRLIAEEFDELVVYVASLKKSFSRKLDDHLFIIQQQNQRLDDQTRLIDELAWQVRDLRASVRSVNDKLKAVQETQRDQVATMSSSTPSSPPPPKTDYANVTVRRVPSNRSFVPDDATKSAPRITILNEEVGEGVEIIYEDETNEYFERDDDLKHQQRLKDNLLRECEEDDTVEGIYEPIQFVERRDYKAPAPSKRTLPSSPSPNTSLSAKHRQTKQQFDSLPTSPPVTERNDLILRSVSAIAAVGQSTFYRPLPSPPPTSPPTTSPPLDPERSLLRTKDYPLVQTRRRLYRNGSVGPSVVMTDIEEEQLPEEQSVDEFIRISSSSTTPSERDTNSIKRRAYVTSNTLAPQRLRE